MIQAICRRARSAFCTLAHSWYARSLPLGRLNAELRLPLGTAVARSGEVQFPQLEIQVPKWAAERLLRGYRLILDLRRNFQGRFALRVVGKELHIEADGIDLLVRTWGDIDVMHEILVRQLYQFELGRRCIVWDIGMNVGMASLYFASMPSVEAVYGYELFPPTGEMARANFALNPALASKINSRICGLGARAEVLELPYHEELKGVVGLRGPLVESGLALRRVPVEVMPADEALAQLRAAHPSLPIVLKMDCEGAEGEILDNLAAANKLRDISLILLEWHGADMRLRLQALLSRHGFASVSQPFSSADVGSLTAFRSPSIR